MFETDDEVGSLYKQISDVRIHRGSNRNGIIASCIYKACCLQGSPRSTQEIAEIFQISIKNTTMNLLIRVLMTSFC